MDTTRRTLTMLGLSITVLVAACGGGPATTGGPATSSGPGAPGASSGGSASRAPGGGPATQAPGGGATVDGCTLLTTADIEAVTGNETESFTARPMFGIFPSGCEWKLIDSEAIVPPSIGFGVMTAGGRDYYEAYFAPFIEENGYVVIEGLGDEALEDEAGAVLVISGDTFFNVQYIGGGFGGDDTAVSTDLARRVAANLGG